MSFDLLRLLLFVPLPFALPLLRPFALPLLFFPVRLLPFSLPLLVLFVLPRPLLFGLPHRFLFVLPRPLLLVPLRLLRFVLVLDVPFVAAVPFVRPHLLRLPLLLDSSRHLQPSL